MAKPTASRPLRILEVACAVACWIALGFAFHLRPNAYLLLGVPLTAAFQWGIRREPSQPRRKSAVGTDWLPLVGVHGVIGVPLSFRWRRSGNLFVPGFTHAFIGAVRNSLFILTQL